ncbi:hypothetical protein N7523_010216 [Penicillium sp. IBT 18751x]|nr:hypothetical protein N7523_010216 [Penicillium sp. IBT 18751x]
MRELENGPHGLSATEFPQSSAPHAGDTEVDEEQKLKLAVEPFRSVIAILTKL